MPYGWPLPWRRERLITTPGAAMVIVPVTSSPSRTAPGVVTVVPPKGRNVTPAGTPVLSGPGHPPVVGGGGAVVGGGGGVVGGSVGGGVVGGSVVGAAVVVVGFAVVVVGFAVVDVVVVVCVPPVRPRKRTSTQ